LEKAAVQTVERVVTGEIFRRAVGEKRVVNIYHRTFIFFHSGLLINDK
jgi:hypothetical protein